MMPGDDDSRADEHQQIEPLGVEHPADERDQRDAQEVERDHHDRVGDAQRVGEAIVRRGAAERETDRPDPLMRGEPQRKRRDRCRSAPCTICITFIQNRIAIVLCTGISFLVPMFDTA